MTAGPQQSHRALGLFAFVLFFALFLAGLAPFSFEFPLEDMEGGWILASVYAGLHHFAYGTQFVFTNGPLFPIYHREYAFEATGWYVLARLALAVYFAWAFARLSMAPGRSAWLVVIVAVLLLWPSISYQANDALLLVLPLAIALLALNDRGGWPGLIAGTIAAAAISLGKVSFIPFCLGAFLLVDIALVARRRPPLALLVYAAAGWALFVLAGQRPGDVLPFLVGSAQMASGYTAALSLDGPAIELWLYLGIWAVVLSGIAIREIDLVGRREDTALLAVLRVLLLAGFFFISLKAGFVRHDGHAIAAWGMLGFAVIVAGLPGALPHWRPRVSWSYYALPLVATVALYGFFVANGRYVAELTTVSARVLAQQVNDGIAFAANPAGWLEKQQEISDGTFAQIRAAQPLPPLTGPVDALSNIQSAVIAAGLDYAPRPTVQENMTITPALVARNAAYLFGPEAPAHLLFAPGATDTRHPASVEGALWPQLLAQYAIAGETAGQLVLDRRAVPADVHPGPATPLATGFGQEIALPAGAPLFLKLTIRETLLGRLADAAFKPPLVHLLVRYADGRSETYRLIPGMIADGMVVSPTIRSIADFRALASGGAAGLDAPVALSVTTEGDWAYDATIAGSLAPLVIP